MLYPSMKAGLLGNAPVRLQLIQSLASIQPRSISLLSETSYATFESAIRTIYEDVSAKSLLSYLGWRVISFRSFVPVSTRLRRKARLILPDLGARLLHYVSLYIAIYCVMQGIRLRTGFPCSQQAHQTQRFPSKLTLTMHLAPRSREARPHSWIPILRLRIAFIVAQSGIRRPSVSCIRGRPLTPILIKVPVDGKRLLIICR